MNVLSMHALIGTYREEFIEWVDELNQVLEQNMKYTYDFITNNVEGIEQGAYMVFLHCEDYCLNNHLTIDELIQKGWDVGVDWQSGV